MPRRSANDPVIRAVDLSLARGEAGRVVDGVSFELGAGGCLALMGATGAGKSTLAGVLGGAEEPGVRVVGGRAHVLGTDVRRRGRALRVRRYRTGLLPQAAGANLPSRLTVSEVIGWPVTSRDRRVNTRALAVRVAALLDELGLPLGAASKYPYELSAGMRQRVALAQALVLDPPLIVADEPYANLDPEVRRTVRDALLRRRGEQGAALVVVTNDQDAVGDLDAETLVLRAGRVVAAGRGPANLLWTPDEGAPT